VGLSTKDVLCFILNRVLQLAEKTIPWITFKIIPLVMKQKKATENLSLSLSRNRKFRYSVWNFFFLSFDSQKNNGSRPWRCFKVLSFVDLKLCDLMFEIPKSRDMPLWRLVQGRVMEKRLQRKLIPSRTSTVDNHYFDISKAADWGKSRRDNLL